MKISLRILRSTNCVLLPNILCLFESCVDLKRIFQAGLVNPSWGGQLGRMCNNMKLRNTTDCNCVA